MSHTFPKLALSWLYMLPFFIYLFWYIYIINLWTIWSNTWIIHSAILQPDIHRTCVSIWVVKQPYRYMLIIFKKKKKKKDTCCSCVMGVTVKSNSLITNKTAPYAFCLELKNSWVHTDFMSCACIPYTYVLCACVVIITTLQVKKDTERTEQNKNSWKKKHNTCITQHLCICTCFP